jgi:hypothetical protein
MYKRKDGRNRTREREREREQGGERKIGERDEKEVKKCERKRNR